MDLAKKFKLIVSLIIPIGLGSIAGIFTTKEIAGWYASLNKPSFNPPSYLFGLVWTALYILMGVSLFLIWNTPKTSDNVVFNYLHDFAFQKDKTSCRLSSNPLFDLGIICNCSKYFYLVFKQIRKQLN